VDWFSEKPCFESFLKELALFYTPEPVPAKDGAEAVERREYVLRTVEMTLFPALKTRFIAVKRLVQEKRVVEIADLPGLYKIFERC
jgi:DNA mismatch repair protein MLH1